MFVAATLEMDSNIPPSSQSFPLPLQFSSCCRPQTSRRFLYTAAIEESTSTLPARITEALDDYPHYPQQRCWRASESVDAPIVLGPRGPRESLHSRSEGMDAGNREHAE